MSVGSMIVLGESIAAGSTVVLSRQSWRVATMHWQMHPHPPPEDAGPSKPSATMGRSSPLLLLSPPADDPLPTELCDAADICQSGWEGQNRIGRTHQIAFRHHPSSVPLFDPNVATHRNSFKGHNIPCTTASAMRGGDVTASSCVYDIFTGRSPSICW